MGSGIVVAALMTRRNYEYALAALNAKAAGLWRDRRMASASLAAKNAASNEVSFEDNIATRSGRKVIWGAFPARCETARSDA